MKQTAPIDHLEAVRTASRHIDRGETDQAAALVTRVLAAEPGRPDALYLSGLLHERAGTPEAAVECYRKALAQTGDLAVLHAGLGRALHASGRPAHAAAAFESALALDPGSVEVHTNFAAALSELGRFDEACSQARIALQLSPDCPEALGNLGSALSRMGRGEEAAECLRRALEMPSTPATSYRVGFALAEELRRQERFDEALACLRQLLAGGINTAEVAYEMGQVLVSTGHFQEGITEFRRALSKKPLAKAGYELGVALLRLGNLGEGLPQFEYRWSVYGKHLGSMAAVRGRTEPLWDGCPFPGQTLLLHAEQGLGDTIHFARYAAVAGERGGTVILEVQPELKRLLAGLPGVSTTVARGEALPPFDLQCPLMSLPLAFGTTVDTIPGRVPYLRADPALRSEWRARLRDSDGLRVGIVWSGGPFPLHRGLPLADMAPLFANQGVSFYSFQIGAASADLARWKPSGRVRNLAPLLTDFTETAAGLAEMDLVITVDTSVAHLAGALGLETWTLLKFVPDWRWFLDREDSPWYPGMRLFRQTEPGNWGGVIERVRAALDRRAAQA